MTSRCSSATSMPTVEGVDNEWLTPERARVLSAAQHRAGHPLPGARRGTATARRCRASRCGRVGIRPRRRRLGVDIIQNCEVTGIRRDVRRGRRRRDDARTNPGPKDRRASRPAHSAWWVDGGVDAARNFPLQALVSEPVKPVLPLRGDVQHHPRLHQPVRQRGARYRCRHRRYTSYSQRGALHVSSTRSRRSANYSRCFGGMRMLRNWGGIVDVTPDRSPIIGKTPVPGFYVNCGSGNRGFKATPGPGMSLPTLANGRPHPINAPFSLGAFPRRRADRRGGCAAVAHRCGAGT